MDAPGGTALPHPGRVLGLDLGSRRIGAALSDSDQRVALPLEILHRSGDVAADHRAIVELVASIGACAVVIGLPLSLSGATGPAARAALGEVEALRSALGVPVVTVDERLSTVEVTRRRREAEPSARRRRRPVDDEAAALLLQRHLDTAATAPTGEYRRMSAPFTPSGATGVVAVIGDPVRHSLSPALHNAAYRALGVDLAYVAFAPRRVDVDSALKGAAALGFVGLSVTTPHKEAVAVASDQRSPLVERLGAANTVCFLQGVSVAHSTDGGGLLDDLADAFGFSPEGRRCAVLGAGGAARAVILALADAGAAEVLVVNRTPGRAEEAARLAGPSGRVAPAAELPGVDLVVNATSVGLTADAEANAEQAELGAGLCSGQLCVDLVYHPAVTPFLAGARAAGATVRNGLGMLVHQAARQVELFTRQSAPLEEMWAAVAGRPTS